MVLGFSTDVVVRLVQNVPVAIPDVRRRALMESVRSAQNREEIFDMLLDSVSSSPYLAAHQKEQLAELFIRGDMGIFSVFFDSTAVSDTTTTAAANHHGGGAEQEGEILVDEVVFDGELDDQALNGMLEMVRLIFVHSRKLAALPVDRRRQIMEATLRNPHLTIDELRQLVIQQLPVSLSLDRHERQLVANDILDRRYYRLLLPDRFDCDEPLPRVVPSSSVSINNSNNSECPICLNEFTATNYSQTQIVQCCGQRFCTTCVADWTHQQPPPRQPPHRQPRTAVECPLCRTIIPPALPPPLSLSTTTSRGSSTRPPTATTMNNIPLASVASTTTIYNNDTRRSVFRGRRWLYSTGRTSI